MEKLPLTGSRVTPVGNKFDWTVLNVTNKGFYQSFFMFYCNKFFLLNPQLILPSSRRNMGAKRTSKVGIFLNLRTADAEREY